jgi:uncharacterized membrane protein YjjP (DUF1212 family)
MSAPIRSTNLNAWRIFRWPLTVGIASVAGLVSALVGDGWYDVVSWLLLGGGVLW